MESSTVSQQLALLRARDIVTSRKQGTSVYYRVVDPLIFDLLDVARQIFNNHLVDLQAAAGAADTEAQERSSLRGDAVPGWRLRMTAGGVLLMLLPLLLYAVGAALALAFGRRALGLWGGHLAAALGGLAGLAVALHCLLGSGVERASLGVAVAVRDARAPARLALSAFFLLVISLVAVAVALYAPGYILGGHGSARGLGVALNGFLASMVLVILADSVLAFMLAWELMSLVSFFLVVEDHHQAESRRAGLVYLVITHIGGAFLLGAFLLLAAQAGSRFRRTPRRCASAGHPRSGRRLPGGAGRLRRKGRPDPAARLAAARASGRPQLRLGSNQDITGIREGFGREGKGLTNSYLRAKEVSPGMLVVIGTSRDRTFQAGKLLLVNLGGTDVSMQSEARSSAQDLTPDCAGRSHPVVQGVGRYYDVVPLAGKADQYLATWADGAGRDRGAGDGQGQPRLRHLRLRRAEPPSASRWSTTSASWEVSPLADRQARRAARAQGRVHRPGHPVDAARRDQRLRLDDVPEPDGRLRVKKVRISEGFSSEEGFPDISA